MKRPLVLAALVYAGGLVLGDHFQAPFGFLCAVSLALAIGAIFWAEARHWLLWPMLLFTGWTNFIWHAAICSPLDLRLSPGDCVELVTVRGTLSETPSQRVFVQDEKEFSRSLAKLEVTQILRHTTNWQSARGCLLVLTPGVLAVEFFGGQQVEVSGVFSPPPGPRAEGLFDYRSYLSRESIYYQLKAESTNDWLLVSQGHRRPWCDRFRDWAQATLGRGLPVEDEPLRLLRAMTLGWSVGLTNEIYEPFMQSGTMHIFAISGLHIALITGILVALLRVLRVSRSWCGWLVIPLIWLYTAATGWQPSAIRSTIMMTIIIGGWALRRPTDLINSLAAAGLIILLWEPQQLFGASFQLSFFVVLSLALFLPPIQKVRDRLLQTDPLLPYRLIPQWRKWVLSAVRRISTPLATSLAAWLGSLPLCTYYFHLFSPVTLLANLFIVPLSSLALACNVGSLLCGNWFPWATVLLNHSAWFWMRCMTQFSDWCIAIPEAYVYVRGFSFTGLLLYYWLLIGTISGWFWTPKRRPWGAAICVVALGFFSWEWYSSHKFARLTILPYNGSLSVFLRSPNRSACSLIDCGTSNSVQLITKPFLHAQGVNRLPSLMLTHGDLHHVGGAEIMADLFRVRQVCVSPVRFRSLVYRRALERFDQKPGLVRKVNCNERFGAWTVLYPQQGDHFPRADDNALVLRGNINGTSVLLCSDLGRTGQNALLERTRDLRADIVVTGLPYGSEALCDALLDAVQPRLIIVADAEFPVSERASAKLHERLAKREIPVIYTRSTGAVTIDFLPKHWQFRSMSGGEGNGGT